MISIITATYNSEKTLSDTIFSVLNQNFKDYEYIIIDGLSSDNTLKIIKEAEDKFKEQNIPFTWISEKDTGIYDAWNKGLTLSNGDWIAFLGSDDRYLPGALSAYSNILDNNKSLDYVSSKVKITKNSKVIRVITGKWNWRVFKRHMNVAHVGSIHSKQYFKIYGKFNTSYKIAGDYELLLRAKDKLKYHFLDIFTAEMDDGGFSNNQVYTTLKETKHVKIKTAGINSFIANLEFMVALLKAKVKTIIT